MTHLKEMPAQCDLCHVPSDPWLGPDDECSHAPGCERIGDDPRQETWEENNASTYGIRGGRRRRLVRAASMQAAYVDDPLRADLYFEPVELRRGDSFVTSLPARQKPFRLERLFVAGAVPHDDQFTSVMLTSFLVGVDEILVGPLPLYLVVGVAAKLHVRPASVGEIIRLKLKWVGDQHGTLRFLLRATGSEVP